MFQLQPKQPYAAHEQIEPIPRLLEMQ
jgi:hypothetical protein